MERFNQTTCKTSIKQNVNHLEISASFYANAHTKGCATNKLYYGVLSALEVDVNFNSNVLTGANGYLRGAIGGHPDVAYGSEITIVAVPLFRGRIPSITDKVQTIITPGITIDVVVTEIGIAVNPRCPDLIKILTKANAPLTTMEELRNLSYKIIGKPQNIEYNYDKIIGLVEYRDGSLIDVIYQPKAYELY